VTAYFDELVHTSIGRHLIVSKSVSSTQQILSAYNTSLPRGTVFVTDVQSHGKGRGYLRLLSRIPYPLMIGTGIITGFHMRVA